MQFDGNGWAVGPIASLDPDEAWSLLARDPSSRVDVARWAHQARTFFGTTLELVQQKKYPSLEAPRTDAFHLAIARGSDARTTRVLVVTVPLDVAPAVRTAADAGVRAVGGAGFDALVARAERVWQVLDRVDDDGDDRAPLAVAAVLASVLLAPIVPPGAGSIFGVKGARERLAARGWT